MRNMEQSYDTGGTEERGGSKQEDKALGGSRDSHLPLTPQPLNRHSTSQSVGWSVIHKLSGKTEGSERFMRRELRK